MKIKLKIITGSLKRKYIEVIKKKTLRPTLSRVRQTVFDILFNLVDFEKIKVLDVCCGTGILGIESISRGSPFCYFVDIDKKSCDELKNNCINLNIYNKVKIINRNILVPHDGEKIELVFIDLPYQSSFLVHKIIKKLNDNKWIDENTLIVIFTEKNNKLHINEKYTIIREITVSNTSVFFIKNNKIIEKNPTIDPNLNISQN